jgi:hypothetical protein
MTLHSPDYLDSLPLFFTLWRVNLHADLILAIILSAHLLRPVRLLMDACSWVKNIPSSESSKLMNHSQPLSFVG